MCAKHIFIAHFLQEPKIASVQNKPFVEDKMANLLDKECLSKKKPSSPSPRLLPPSHSLS